MGGGERPTEKNENIAVSKVKITEGLISISNKLA